MGYQSPQAQTLGLPSNDVGFLAVNTDGSVWVSSGMNVSRLLNDGATQFDWTTFVVATDSTHSAESISALAVYGDRIAVATGHTEELSGSIYSVGDAVYLSDDGAQTWSRYSIPRIFKERADMSVPGGDTQCFGLSFRSADRIWAAFTTEFVVNTGDFGLSWNRFRPDSTNNPQDNPFEGDPNLMRYWHLNYRAFDVAVLDNYAQARIWVSTNSGLNQSANDGRTWTNYDAIKGNLTGDFVPAIAVDKPRNALWAATQASSIDESQLQSNPRDVNGDGEINHRDWDLDADGMVDQPGNAGVSWTTDDGATWNRYIPSLDPAVGRNFIAWDMAFHGDTVWVGGSAGSDDALLVSYDYGSSWHIRPVVTAFQDTLNTKQGILSTAWAAGALWLTTANGLARSTDGGETFELVLRYPQATTLDGGTVVEQGGVTSGLETYAFPSPCAPRAGTVPRIVFALAAQANVTIDIYDAGSGLVRTITLASLPRGNHTVPWDGKDDSGNFAANGIYLYRVRTTAGDEATGRVMVLN